MTEPSRLQCERCGIFNLCFQYGGEWICGDCETLEDELQYMIEHKDFVRLPPLEMEMNEYEEEEEIEKGEA